MNRLDYSGSRRAGPPPLVQIAPRPCVKKQQTKITTDNALIFTGRVSFRFVASTTVRFPAGGFLLVFYGSVGCAVSYQKKKNEQIKIIIIAILPGEEFYDTEVR